MPQIESHAGTGGRATGHQLATAFQTSHTLLPGRRTDVLDHNVHTFFICNLANFFGDLLFVMIDAVIGTQGTTLFEFRFIACGRDHAAMKQLCNLDGGDADTRACTQHEHGLPGPDRCQANQHVPCSYKYQRHTSRLNEIETVGNRNHICRRYGHQLTISAVDRIAENRELTALVLQSSEALHAVSAKMHGCNQYPLARNDCADIFTD